MKLQRKKTTKPKSIKVIIGVENGVAFKIRAPKGLEIEIHDYDTEGMEPDSLYKDKNGNKYSKGIL